MAPTDRIELRQLVVTGICGALPEERERAQPLAVDLDVVADLSAAGASDNLEDTLDYGAITATIERVILTGTPQLLEHLAQNLADAVLADRVLCRSRSLCGSCAHRCLRLWPHRASPLPEAVECREPF